MHDGPRGLARMLAALLPARTAERVFLPAYYDLHARHMAGGRRASALARAAAAVSLSLATIRAALECAAIARGERRPDRKQGVDPMLIQDVRFAVRMLWKNPGFTVVAALALAIGIGANTAIFSVVHAVLLQPLPFAEPSRIVALDEEARGRFSSVSPPNFVDWQARNATLESIAAYNETTATLSGGSEAERFDAVLVGADLFRVLGVPPILGRAFTTGDDREGRQRAVVLGERLWRRRFGADPGIVGRILTFDGRPHLVVGVMPAGFTFPGDIDLWFPLILTDFDTNPRQRGAHYLSVVGRLKTGTTVAQATADLNAIETSIAGQFKQVEGYTVAVHPLLESMVGDVKRPLWMLLGAVGFVLLIACANVSNLLLARASTRRAEIAVRSALGAGRRRIVRQLLAESVMLSLVGGVIGVLLASWGVRALETIVPGDLPRAATIGVDRLVLAFSLGLSILTGLVFGVVPAMYASSPDLSTFLKDARRDGGSSGGRRRFRSALVAIELAMALVLLAGAGLALRSFDRLARVDPGFDPSGLLSVDVALPEARYPDSAALTRFFRQYIDTLGTQPGVTAAGAVSIPPLARGGYGGTFSIIGRDPLSDDSSMQVRAATPGYLEALRVPLRRGRLIAPADTETSAPIAVISEESAKRFWPGQDPIGQRIRIHVSMGKREPEREVVGIVGDVKLRTLDAAVRPTVYVPHSQYSADGMTVFVRTSGTPLAMLPAVKSQLALIDREVALTSATTGDRMMAASVSQARFRMLMLGIFAGIALALASVGLYGVMAFSVTQRRTELGLRIALGAERADVLRLVMFQALPPVAAGIAAGLLGAAALTRAMSDLLFETNAFDPATFAAVAAILSAVALLACYIPARRATAVDPMIAMRND